MVPLLILFLSVRLLALWILPPGGDEISFLYIAEDIAHQRQLPVYFYDQQVIGPLPSYLFAPLFRIFGFSFWGARFYHGMLYLAFAALLLKVIREFFGEELRNRSFLLLTFLPYPMIFFTTVIGWTDILLLALVSFILLLRICDENKKAFGTTFLLGVVCGISVWRSPLFLVWLVPIASSVLWFVPGNWRRGVPWVCLLGFLIGLFPVELYGFKMGTLMSAEGHGGSLLTSFGDGLRMVYLFFARMKYFLFTFPYGLASSALEVLVRWLSLIPLTIFALSFLSFLVSFARSKGSSTPQRNIFSVFMLTPPVVLLIAYCSRNLVSGDEGMRFLIPLLIPYTFCIAWWLGRIQAAFLRRTVLGILVGIQVWGYVFPLQWAWTTRTELSRLARFLESHDLRYGMANFRTAYALNILTDHRVLATPLPGHAINRSLWAKVKSAGPRFLILDKANPEFRNRLARDSRLKQVQVGPYDIFYGESSFLARLLRSRGLVI